MAHQQFWAQIAQRLNSSCKQNSRLKLCNTPRPQNGLLGCIVQKTYFWCCSTSSPCKNTSPSLEKVKSLCKLLIKTECKNWDLIHKPFWLNLKQTNMVPHHVEFFQVSKSILLKKNYLLPLQSELRKVNGLINCSRLISRSLLVSV